MVTLTVGAVNDPPHHQVPDPQTVKENDNLKFIPQNANLIALGDVDIEAESQDIDGMERGNYTWNPKSGTFNAIPIVDTISTTPLADKENETDSDNLPHLVTIIGNELTATDTDGGKTFTLVEGDNLPPFIVGAWQFGNGSANDSGVVVFLPNGIYFFAEDTEADAEEFDGMERGTYEWNQETGAFIATPIVDTSGTTGFNDPFDSVTIEGDELTLSDSDGSETLTRVVQTAFNPIVGAWQIGNGKADESRVAVFLPGGAYFFIKDTVDTAIQTTLAVSSGQLTLNTVPPGVQLDSATPNGGSTLSLTGRLHDINRALDGLNYSPTPATTSDTLRIVTNDRGHTGAGGPQETTSTVAIQVIPLNAPPQLIFVDADRLEVFGDAPPSTVFPGLIIQDADNDHLQSAEIRLIENFVSNQDTLFINKVPSGLEAGFDRESGALTIQGSAPVAAYQDLLQRVAFVNSSPAPQTAERIVEISVHDGTSPSNPIRRNLSVSVLDIPPRLSNATNPTRTFEEDGLPIALLSLPSVTQGSAGALIGATAQIEQGFVPGQDQLSGRTGPGLDFHYDSSSGRLTLSGKGSGRQYAAALGSIVYRNTSEAPQEGLRTVSFVVEGPNHQSNSLSVRVTVISVNDSPTLHYIARPDLEFDQGVPPLALFPSLSLSDPDHGQLGAATILFARGFQADADLLELGPLPSGLTTSGFDKTTGSLTIEGPASHADYQSALQSIVYRNDSDFTQDRTLAVSLGVADPDGKTSTTVSQSLQLIGRSTPPEFVGLQDLSFPEDTKAFVLPFQVKDDRTPGAELIIEFDFKAPETLFDGESISIDREGGEAKLALRPLPNGFGEAEVNVTATDAQALSTTASIKVNVIGKNDLPLLTATPLSKLFFRDGSGPKQLFDEVLIKDTDHETLEAAKIRFVAGFQPHQDLLATLPSDLIQITFDPETGELKLQGEAPIEHYAERLTRLTYFNRSHQPHEGLRSLTLSIQDTLETSSKEIKLEIEVSDDNLLPVGVGDQVHSGEEPTVTIPVATLLANDTDPDNDSLTVSLVTRQTAQGHFIAFSNDEIVIPRPQPDVPDRFHYTLSDQQGGLVTVPVDVVR